MTARIQVPDSGSSFSNLADLLLVRAQSFACEKRAAGLVTL